MNIRISCEHDNRQIPLVAKTVCHLCVLADTEKRPTKNMELALVELLTNIIAYSNAAPPSGMIDLDCRYTGGDFTVTVSDSGNALSTQVARQYTNGDISMPGTGSDPIENIALLPESGWGIQLIKSLCEDVSYKRISGKNIYRLTFDLASAAA